MSLFSDNIKFLRESKGLNQSDMLDAIGFARTTWNQYERGKNQPSLSDFQKIAAYFNVTLDDIIKVDLSKTHLNEKVTAQKIQVKAHPIAHANTHLNTRNHEVSGMVQESETPYYAGKNNVYDLDSLAAAGVALFVSDGDRRKTLPTLYFPWLGPGLHIRIGIAGDSMHPTVKDGDKTISTWVDDLANLREGNVYIILDKEDGLVCKRIYRHHTKNTLEFISDNDTYKPYNRHLSSIIAIFRISEVITTDLRPEMSNFQKQLREIRLEVDQIKKNMGTK